MSTTLKIILGILVGLIVLCGCAAAGFFLMAPTVRRTVEQVVEQAIITDLAQVAAVSSEIAIYTLPEGFGQPFAAQAAGYTLVGYNGTDGDSHIFFFQLPQGQRMDPSEIEKQARQAMEPGKVASTETRVVERKPGVIAGQEVTLILSEGINHDKQPFREVTAVFDGKGGQALVNFSRPTALWNDAEVEAFLASIQ